MKTLAITFSFSIILFFACKKEEKNKVVFSNDRMTEILTEFQLAEAIIRSGYHRGKDSIILNDSIYSALFRDLGISQAQFDSSYNYYIARPEEMEKIYDQVLINLSKRSAEIQSEIKDDPA